MSKFFKALEEAERDRALRNGSPREAARPRQPAVPAPVAPAPVAPAPVAHAPVTRTPAEESAWHPETVATPADGVDDHLVSLVTPTTFEAEQYRALRHVVEQQHRATGLKVLAVSSPGAADGKTMTAINLAGALAQAPEVRVLLVDADLRRPALSRLLGFGEASGPGLVGAILEPRLGLEQVVQPRPPYNLSVVCAGATPASPYDVLKSPRFGELLEEARHLYDYVVVDTPPLTPVQDCRVIDRWVDGFLLVVAALWTPRRLVEEALAILDRKKILGLVFNAEEESSISGYQSRYYGGYYAPRQSPPSSHSGRLTRAASTIGDSLRGHRARPGFATDGRQGDPR